MSSSPSLPLPTAWVKVSRSAGLLTCGSTLCLTFPRFRSGISRHRSPLTVAGAVVDLGPGVRSACTTFPINPQRFAFEWGTLPDLCAFYCNHAQEGFRHCSSFLRRDESGWNHRKRQYLVDNSVRKAKCRGFWLTHGLWAKNLVGN